MRDVIIGVDAGTSVLKAVAFDLEGRQIAAAARLNRYETGPDGSATQSPDRTWSDCAGALRDLAARVPDLARRTAAMGITAQGDGTWLIDGAGAPVGDGWLWLDARAAAEVSLLRERDTDRARFETTGTGLSACHMGPQLSHMQRHTPEILDAAATAFHCKDWLYLQLTGVRATDPSEGVLTFGDFRTRVYNEDVIAAFGLTGRRGLLPPLLDGTSVSHGLTEAAARATGLRAGTPVSLGYLDVICTALGAGIHTTGVAAGCTVLGSTGMHMHAMRPEEVTFDAGATGYVFCLPIPGLVAQSKSNMAATLNMDWLLDVAADLGSELGADVTRADLLRRMDGWIEAGAPAALLYHPYISDAGERGPFVDSEARASLIGLNSGHRFRDLARAVVEGMCLATRDCYVAMGPVPPEIRVTGGAVRSPAVRRVLAAVLDRPVRPSLREEAGAAGAAMIAACAIGVHGDMEACIAEWVTPVLGKAEAPDADLAARYAGMFEPYLAARLALAPVWGQLRRAQD